MSWLISRALMEDYANSRSLPGLVAEYLEGTCSDGAPFAPSSGNPTPQAYLPPDKMTAFSRPSRFGMTFAPLTDDRGAELLTWFREASRARTSAPQALVLELTENDQGFGGKWRELSAKYDRASCMWRTHRSLWDEGLPESSVILPKWGSMRGGVCSELLTLEHHTAANDAGLLPTPLASNTKANHMRSGGRPARSYWPTPLATDGSKGGPNQKGGKGDLRLASAVHQWPTPCARDYFPPHKPEYIAAKKAQGHGMSNLNDAVALRFATPQARDHRTGQPERYENPDRTKNLNDQIGGQLNPTWVEWLMGWPLGWTDLKPLAMDKCRSAQRKHGGF